MVRGYPVISLAILCFALLAPFCSSSAPSRFGTQPAPIDQILQAPVISFAGLSPNPGSPGRTIRLNFTAQDPNGNVTATWVDWGDGSNPDLIFNMTNASMCQSPGTDMCAIAPGDLLFAKPETPASIVNGSIIIFRPYSMNPSLLVAHRVAWIFPPNSTSNRYVFWTKGDANSAVDYWNATAGTPATQVVAVYQYTILPLGPPIDRTDAHAYHVLGGLPSKTFTVTVNATDGRGSQAQFTTTETINDAPPTVGITGASPNPLIAGSKVTLGFVATDPDGVVSIITVNWGDGSSPQNFPGSTPSETHVYSSAGNYTVVVQATDDASLTSIPVYTKVTVKAQPSALAPPLVLGLEPLVFYGVIATFLVALGTAAFLVVRRARIVR